MNHWLGSLTATGAVAIAALGAANASYAQDACLDARVTASDGGLFQSFGYAVGVSGDTVLIGAEWDAELGNEAGAVYVFRPDPDKSGTWAEMQKLLASDQQPGDNFGHSVAMDGNVALIGAGHVHEDGPDVAYGAVYVYRFNGATWVEEQELLASDSAFQDGFGFSVSINGDVALIGTPGDDDDGFGSGSAYVFRFDRNASEWVEEAKLTASDAAAGDSFGLSVSVSGEFVLIGAGGHDDACPKDPICNSGAAYVFRFDPDASQWIEEQKLLASDAAWGDGFGGWSVSISGEAALIGANGDGPGSAYVFRFDPKTSQWLQEQKLVASDPSGLDQFGRAVALDGDTAVIGAVNSDAGGPSSGAAYVFRLDPEASAWIEQAQLLPQPNPWTNFFGWSVAVDGETAVIGAHGEDHQRGAAYLFDLAPNCNCPHDLDADGNVGVSDLLALLASWGPCPGCPGDFDGNDEVGVSDLLVLLANWGPCR